MGQDTIVLVIVGVCAALVAWRIVRRLRGRKGGCGCGDGSSGCSGCNNGAGRGSQGCGGRRV